MFERYTESARRVLFFSRYEVAQLGGVEIGAEHLLLGLMREGKGVAGQILSSLPSETIRNEIKRQSVSRAKLATSVEVPFTQDAKRALNWAKEEADLLAHSHIGPEHLLLGLLRDEKSGAGKILHTHGLRLEDARSQIAHPPEPARHNSTATRPQTLEQIVQIERLVQQLAQTLPGTDAAHVLVEQIRGELDVLRQLG